MDDKADWIEKAKVALTNRGHDAETAHHFAEDLYDQLVADDVDPEAVDPVDYACGADLAR